MNRSLGLAFLVLLSVPALAQDSISDSDWAIATISKYQLPGFDAPKTGVLSPTQVALIAYRACNNIKAQNDRAVRDYEELERYLKRHPNLATDIETLRAKDLITKVKRELHASAVQREDCERIIALLKSNASQFKALGIDRNRMKGIATYFKVRVEHLQVKEP